MLTDFRFCPYCGQAAPPPGPGLDEALELPFAAMEAVSPRQDGQAQSRSPDRGPAERRFAAAAARLCLLEEEMELILEDTGPRPDPAAEVSDPDPRIARIPPPV